MRVRPSSTTCEMSLHSSPSTTSGPMVEKGPTVQEAGTTAPWRDDRAGMNAHSAVTVWSRAPRFAVGLAWLALARGTTWQVSVASQASLPSTSGPALDAPRAGPERQHVHLDADLIAGRDRPAELGALDAGKDHQLFVAVGHLGHHDDAAGLGHRLNHQHAGHDGIAGKMALKERLVDGHVLDGHQALGRLELDDPVDQRNG